MKELGGLMAEKNGLHDSLMDIMEKEYYGAIAQNFRLSCNEKNGVAIIG